MVIGDVSSEMYYSDSASIERVREAALEASWIFRLERPHFRNLINKPLSSQVLDLISLILYGR